MQAARGRGKQVDEIIPPFRGRQHLQVVGRRL